MGNLVPGGLVTVSRLKPSRRRRSELVVRLSIAGLLALASWWTWTAASGATGNASISLGDYSGPDNPAGVAHFASSTSAHVTLASDYLVGSSGWGTMVGAQGLKAWRSSGYRLVLGVPMLPSNTQSTLGRGARGAYNSYFVTLARNLVAEGEGNAFLRLGWEFNGGSYKWKVLDSSAATRYAAFFRHIVRAMRSVPGQSFAFVWNPNGAGSTRFSPAQAYPGNAYVDYIGSDVYANCWCSPFTVQNGWANQLSQPWGLDWLASFAARQGKPIVFPEWGVDFRSDGHGLGDDAYFVNQFGSWITAHKVAWTSIFTFHQEHDITDGSFPNALAAFKAHFG